MIPTPFLSAASLSCLLAVGVVPAQAQGLPAHPAGAEGKRIYEKANCVGCHKWHGDGGGGYGGAALSLRKTELDRAQMVEVIRCGRPETGMPFHLRGVYDDEAKPCFGASRQDLAKSMPPEAASFLRESEMEAVADYVVTHIKGKSEVTHGDCTAFFGTGSRMCNMYEARPAGAKPSQANPSEAKPAEAKPSEAKPAETAGGAGPPQGR